MAQARALLRFIAASPVPGRGIHHIAYLLLLLLYSSTPTSGSDSQTYLQRLEGIAGFGFFNHGEEPTWTSTHHEIAANARQPRPPGSGRLALNAAHFDLRHRITTMAQICPGMLCVTLLRLQPAVTGPCSPLVASRMMSISVHLAAQARHFHVKVEIRQVDLLSSTQAGGGEHMWGYFSGLSARLLTAPPLMTFARGRARWTPRLLTLR